MNQKRIRQHYTKEFKRDAVNLVLEHGYSGNEAARRLGINQTNISRWVREYRQENEPSVKGGATRSELETELKRLRKENQRLQMEREILKKAAAFFAKESK
jgi:transposase